MATTRITASIAVVLASGLLLTGCGEDSPARVGTGSTTTPSTAPSTSEPTPSATPTTQERALAVYYLADTGRSVRLQREFRKVTLPPGAALDASVEAVLHTKPLDPDYSSLWPAATKVLNAEIDGEVATVNLSKEARNQTNAGAEAEGMSLQQLVWTVTANDPSVKSVRLLIEGQPAGDLWGHGAVPAGPMTRDEGIEVLHPITIDSPAQGASVGRRLAFQGTATVFEATVSWTIVAACEPPATACSKPDGEYAEGFVTASDGAPARGTWRVETQLPASVKAGQWIRITAFESSAEDGRVLHPDTKVVRVSA